MSMENAGIGITDELTQALRGNMTLPILHIKKNIYWPIADMT